MTLLRPQFSEPIDAGSRLALVPTWESGELPRRAVRAIPASGHGVLTNPQWTAVGLALRLSPRELQIVQGVFDDQKESAIAGNLGISSHTVHTHLERLYRKIGARGRTSMMVRVFAELLRLNARGGEEPA